MKDYGRSMVTVEDRTDISDLYKKMMLLVYLARLRSYPEAEVPDFCSPRARRFDSVSGKLFLEDDVVYSFFNYDEDRCKEEAARLAAEIERDQKRLKALIRYNEKMTPHIEGESLIFQHPLDISRPFDADELLSAANISAFLSALQATGEELSDDEPNFAAFSEIPSYSSIWDRMHRRWLTECSREAQFDAFKMLCIEGELIERETFVEQTHFFVFAYRFPSGHDMQSIILRTISHCFNNDAFLFKLKDEERKELEKKRFENVKTLLEHYKMFREELVEGNERKFSDVQKGSAFK